MKFRTPRLFLYTGNLIFSWCWLLQLAAFLRPIWKYDYLTRTFVLVLSAPIESSWVVLYYPLPGAPPREPMNRFPIENVRPKSLHRVLVSRGVARKFGLGVFFHFCNQQSKSGQH